MPGTGEEPFATTACTSVHLFRRTDDFSFEFFRSKSIDASEALYRAITELKA